MAEVDENLAFWVNQGPVIRDVAKLPAAIKNMSKEQFKHHVNKERNDFANWIRDVFGNKKLAGSIAKVKTKKTMIKRLEDALN